MQPIAVMTRCARPKKRDVTLIDAFFPYTAGLTSRSNDFCYRTFVPYSNQWMSKLDVSFLMQPPLVAYKRDVSWPVPQMTRLLVEQPCSRACQGPRCNTCNCISSVKQLSTGLAGKYEVKISAYSSTMHKTWSFYNICFSSEQKKGNYETKSLD